MEMEKEEAEEDDYDEDDAEEEEINNKIVEIKKKRKPYEDESDLDSSRYYFNWSFYIYTFFTY